MSSNNDNNFISMTEDSVFKKFFKGKFKWFYRDLIYDYTGIDINDYVLYDNEINIGKKKNKGDKKLDIVLIKKDNTKVINIELNKYNCLKRNEMYLHSLTSNLYSLYKTKAKKVPDVVQLNINIFKTKKEFKTHIALRNRGGKIIIKNFQIYDLNLYIKGKKSYNKDKRLELLVCNSFEKMEKVIGGEEKYMEILEELKRLSNNGGFMNIYDPEADMAFMMDEIKEHAEEDGIEIGKKQGKVAGRKETQRKTAKRMLNEGLGIDLIKKCTGLSKSAITALM